MAYTIVRLKKKINRFYTIRARKIQDLIIFFLLTFGVLLPVRWFFYNYVTHGITYNIGIITLIAIITFLLIRSGKLGFAGRAFNRQMMRFVSSRTLKRVMFFSVALSFYTGVSLLLMERGEFVHQDNLQLFDAISIRSDYIKQYVINNTEPISNGKYMPLSTFCDMRPKECILDPTSLTYEKYKPVMLNTVLPNHNAINKVNNMTLMEAYNYNSRLSSDYDFLFSTAMYLANVQSNGQSSYFLTVLLVGEIEAIGLFFLYRKLYLKKSIGDPWLNMYDVNLKRIMYKTKNKDKFYSGKSTKPEDKKPIMVIVVFATIAFGFMVLRWLYNEPIFVYIAILIMVVISVYILVRKKKN